MFRDNPQSKEGELHSRQSVRMQKKIDRLKFLANKYKRAERIQDALLGISNLANKALNLDSFYLGVHSQLQQLLPADNFFISLKGLESGNLEVPFFRDEKDPHPSSQYPKDELSSLLLTGLTGYVYRNGEPLLCDQDKFDQLVQAQEIKEVGSECHQWLGVPISHGDIILGVMVVQSYDPETSYGELELELMTFISHHISGVMERLRYNEQIQLAIEKSTVELSSAYKKLKEEVYERRRAERLQKSLFEIANLAASSDGNTDFYKQLHEIISQLIPANNCYIALTNDSQTELSFPFYASQQNNQYPNVRPLRDGLTEYILKRQQPMLLTQAHIQELVTQGQIYHLSPELNQTKNMHQWIGVPLFIHGQVRGALTIFSLSMSHDYQDNDLELLTFVSQHISTAIERKMTADKLKQGYELLEEKVLERTQALALLNEDLEREITQRIKVEQRLLHDAKHDGLTALPNRALFMDRLSQAIKHIRRHEKEKFGLLFLDLDRFKLINDTLGHVEGDKFLIETAKRLAICIRENDTLARIGGDEFVILLDGIHKQKDAEEVAERVLIELSRPYILNNQEFKSGASIGISLSSQTETAESMLRNADSAMYQAKSQGRGCYVVFDNGQQKVSNKGIELEKELRQAINENALSLCYFPIVNLETNAVRALEVRLYWQHPSMGKIKHAQLYNMAEQADLLVELDNYKLAGLNNEYRQLHALMGTPPKIHFSLSSQHLKHKHALRSIKNAIQDSRIANQKIWLFFTEKAVAMDSDTHINAFEQLAKLEVNIGIAKYGTGNCALSLLAFSPVNALKLDASLVCQISNKRQQQLLQTYAQAGVSLDLEVFADGIGSEEDKTLLQSFGYCCGQGQALGKMLTLESSQELISA